MSSVNRSMLIGWVIATSCAIAAALIAQPNLTGLATSPADRLTAIDGAEITWDDALNRVRKEVIGGEPLSIEAGILEGAPIHIVCILVGGRDFWVTLDAKTGGVMTKGDGRNQRDAGLIEHRLREPNVGLTRAMLIAEHHASDYKAYAVALRIRGSDLIYDVKLASDSAFWEIRLNAVGEVIESGPPKEKIRK